MAYLSFFFFLIDSHLLSSDSHQTWQIQPELGCTGRIILYRPAAETDRNNQNQFWIRPKHPKSVISQFYSEYLLLLLCFLFCFVFLAFENIFEMKRITYRKYIENDVVCMLSQQWNIFVIICLHAFPECSFACFQRMLFACFPVLHRT